jgi:hypothetical protein
MLIKCDVRPLRGRFYISSFYFYKCATSPRSVLYFFFLFLQMCDLSEVGSIFLLFISTNVRPLRGRFYISSFYFYKCATSPRSVLYFFFLFLQMCDLSEVGLYFFFLFLQMCDLSEVGFHFDTFCPVHIPALPHRLFRIAIPVNIKRLESLQQILISRM